MILGPHDLHFIFDDDYNRLQGYDATGKVVFRAEARNRAVGGDGFGHDERCPRGTFLLGAPVRKDAPAFGHWFTPLLDFAGHHAMRDFGRAGIGFHGGGSGLPHPMAPLQGWYPTEGCIRGQNSANDQFAPLVHAAQQAGGKCYWTTIGA